MYFYNNVLIQVVLHLLTTKYCIFRMLNHNLKPAALSAANNVKLIRGGKPYFDLLLYLINNAVECIHLQTYIFDDDETGTQVTDALKAAVKRNVSVYLLADGYASQIMSVRFIDELKTSGINFRFFEPFLKAVNFILGEGYTTKYLLLMPGLPLPVALTLPIVTMICPPLLRG